MGLKEVANAKLPGILYVIETVMDEKDEHGKLKLISAGTDGAAKKFLPTGWWKLYRYSSLPQAVRELKDLADAMEINVGKPTKTDWTRWVSHLLRAIKC